MQSETVKKLEKIRQISSALRTACKVLLVLMGLLFIAGSAGIFVGSMGVIIRFFDVTIPVALLTLPARLGLIVLLAVSTGVLAKGLYHLDRLFGLYANGDVFTVQTAVHIRQLGLTAIFWTGVHILWPITEIVLSGAPAPHSFALQLDSLFIGIAIIAVSWFMDAAAEIRAENDLTI